MIQSTLIRLDEGVLVPSPELRRSLEGIPMGTGSDGLSEAARNGDDVGDAEPTVGPADGCALLTS